MSQDFPIGNPENGIVQIKHSGICDYCHINRGFFLIAGKQKRFDLICLDCYHKEEKR